MKTETKCLHAGYEPKMVSQEKFQFIKVLLLNMIQVFKWEDYSI